MNGNIVLDTNILIYLSKKIISPEQVFENNMNYCVSVITKMELLGYPFQNGVEENFLINLLNALQVIPLTDTIVDATIMLRKSNKIKLPDAIVYATAKVLNGKLVTNNINDFDKITGNIPLVNPIKS